MSLVFCTKNLQDTGIDNVFFLEKSCRKLRSFPRCNVNRGKVTSTEEKWRQQRKKWRQQRKKWRQQRKKWRQQRKSDVNRGKVTSTEEKWRQQRKSDVMTYFGLYARSAVYYQACSPFHSGKNITSCFFPQITQSWELTSPDHCFTWYNEKMLGHSHNFRR
jgi:hypothetical protein